MSFPNFALHSKPVNRVAAKVAFGESQAWEPKRGVAPQETFDCPPQPVGVRPQGSQDFTGFRRGFMTALRYHGRVNAGQQWLCRCDCGKYEFRIAPRWSKKPDAPDACTVCQRTHFVVRGCTLGDTPQANTARRRANSAKQQAKEAP